MSVTTVERAKTTTHKVRVYVCDGPECSKSVDVTLTPAAEVPPGWIFTTMEAGKTKHYCSTACLADVVVP